MIQGQNILITGGAGFIGSKLAERLFENNHVTLLDVDFSERSAFARTSLANKVKCVEASIEDYAAIEPFFKDVDI